MFLRKKGSAGRPERLASREHGFAAVETRLTVLHTQRPMHVLSIAPSFSTTGVSVHVGHINHHLLTNGHQVTVAPLSVDEPRLFRFRGERCETYPLAPRCGATSWFDEKIALVDTYVEGIEGILGGERVDLIHTHDWLAALAGRRLADRLGCPHLSTVHTLAEIQRRQVGLPGRLPAHAGQIALEEDLCQSPAPLLTVGQAMKKLIVANGHPSSAQIDVIPNGVDASCFSAPDAAAVRTLRRRLAPNGESVVLFVGRLAPQKGVEFLLRSTYLVRKERPATRWVLVGDHVAAYMMRPVYEQVMRDGGARDHLQFEGTVPWQEIAPYYHAADCVVLPSLFESCPYVALEAMVSRRCIIASDLDSMRELIVHGENGLLVPLDNNAVVRGPSVSALAEAQLEVLANPGLRRRLTDAAAKTVEQRFTLDRQLGSIGALYKAVLPR